MHITISFTELCSVNLYIEKRVKFAITYGVSKNSKKILAEHQSPNRPYLKLDEAKEVSAV